MEQPAGRPAPQTPAKPPSGDPLHGRYTSLLPLEQSHSGPLFTHLGGERNSNLWKYIPEPGNPDRATFDDRIRMYITSDVFHPYAILTGPVSDPASEPAGIAAYLAIVPEHLRIEIGGIVGVKLQRTRAMTEVFYLLIKHAIEDLGYHRVEWKAHSENKLSLSAAERLGFLFEGVFRNHMVVDGRVRDTAFFSMTSEDWPAVKKGFEAWLSKNNFDGEGRQVRTLKECRDGLS